MSFDDRPDPAKRLEAARIARGFTSARQAATFFGWVYDSYAQHENGKRGLTRVAAAYGKAFGVSPGWLLTGEGSGPNADAAPDPLRELTPEELTEVKRYARFVIQKRASPSA